jgi:hypothetical protein
MVRYYSFYINNYETEIWKVEPFYNLGSLSYFKINFLTQQGWTYNNLCQEPYIELIEDIELPLYTQPNSMILDLFFIDSQQTNYFQYKGLITKHFRDNALNNLFK